MRWNVVSVAGLWRCHESGGLDHPGPVDPTLGKSSSPSTSISSLVPSMRNPFMPGEHELLADAPVWHCCHEHGGVRRLAVRQWSRYLNGTAVILTSEQRASR
jgi:hypothetical protein